MIPSDDQVNVVIGFAACRIQEGGAAHVALFFPNAIGRRRGGCLNVHIRCLGRRAPSCAHVTERSFSWVPFAAS